MNSYRRGLQNGVLVNPKLSILEKVNSIKLSQTWSNVLKKKLVLFGTGRYKVCGFLILVSFFLVLNFFLGVHVICLDGRKMGEKNGGF